MTETVCVGTIAGAYGVRGEVRLKSFTAEPTGIADYGPVQTEDGARRFTINLIRPVKGGFTARLIGIETKEQADALKGTRLYLPRTALPSLPDDEFYHADLIGLEVFDTGGEAVGRVKSVQSNGADDLLELHGPGLKNTVLLLFTRANVPTVDLAAGRIVIDPPEGTF